MKTLPYIIFHTSLRPIIFCLSAIFLVIAFVSSLDERNTYNREDIQRTTIILDVSNSMNVADGNKEGRSRLEVAKQKVQEIIITHPHQFGLTVFSGTPQRIIPHTSDIALYMTFLEGVGRDNVSEGGTSIQKALIEGIRDFQGETGGSIIVISDGGEESFTNIGTLHEDLQGIDIFIVGVGTQKGGYIPRGNDVFGNTLHVTYQGKKVVSSLDEKNLQKIASKIGGNYSHISDFSYTSGITKNSFFYNISTTFLCIVVSGMLWVYYIVHMLFHKYFFLGRK